MAYVSYVRFWSFEPKLVLGGFLLTLITYSNTCAHLNKLPMSAMNPAEQWGGVPPQGYPQQNSAPYPGPTPNYGQPTYVPPPPQVYNDTKEESYERFKPKKKINDPIFLVLFVLQVRAVLVVIIRAVFNFGSFH